MSDIVYQCNVANENRQFYQNCVKNTSSILLYSKVHASKQHIYTLYYMHNWWKQHIMSVTVSTDIVAGHISYLCGTLCC